MRKGKQALLSEGSQTIFCKGSAEQDVAFNVWALDRNLVITALMVGEASLLHHQALTRKAMFESALAAVENYLRQNAIRFDRALTC
jgi:hypothetical protein